ncbi:hybrid sensor histidine kinase/response regulator [Roseateles chitinivorans]|uniref:hybrid sensor histidine kinase/response regulator n=1 Tax=Roseateles chitinivorans TaxID=2917965 RepID=UPI003D66CE55
MDAAHQAQGRRTILLVDDEAAHRYALRRRLELAGFEVIEAPDGAEALRLAGVGSVGVGDVGGAGIDAIILDVMLPDIDGFEVCRQLRASKSAASVPIIHVSGIHVADRDLVHGLESGADAYLTRPVDEDVLIANLHALLRRRDVLRALSDELDQKRLDEERARDLFLAILGHDLRNPLDAISMSSQLLAKAPLSADLTQKMASRITAASRRMTHMLDDIQDYARSRLGADLILRRTPQRLGALASAAIDEARGANPGLVIELVQESPDDGAWDGDRLSRVIANLLRNAVEHGAEGRPIVVRTGSRAGTRRLSVRNEGRPIPDEVRGRLFEPMVHRTTDAPAASNMGLGLFVCRTIVEAHGGRIDVETDESGTEFRIELPAGPSAGS